MNELWSGIRRRYLRLNIGAKMLFGYLPLVLIISVLSVSLFLRLEQIMAINVAILDQDIPTAETAEGMIENLSAQELYAKSYLILGSEEIVEAFEQHSDEFDAGLARLRSIAPAAVVRGLGPLAELHGGYRDTFRREFAAYRAAPGAPVAFAEQTRVLQDQMIEQLKRVALQARQSQAQRTRGMRDMERGTFNLMLGLTVAGMLVGAGAALAITRNIAASIGTLKSATAQIAEGDFDAFKPLENQDELGDLARAIAEMSQKLKTLEALRLDSSPLTHLPGGMAIENVLDARIRSGEPFAFCLFDIDNFKAFNDRYGYLRGNDVLKQTARIIVDAVRRLGDPRDFVGHIGGDDFVLITAPQRFEPILKDIAAAFDGTIPGLYDPEDRQLGYVEAENRQGVKVRLPFASLSIAVVNSLTLKPENHLQVSEVAASIKGYAKTIPGSKYIVDRRGPEATPLTLAVGQ